MIGQGHPTGVATVAARPAFTAADVAAFLERLPSLDVALPDAERIDLVSGLEAVKGGVAAAQARLAVAFADSQMEAQRAAGVPGKDLGRGVGAQLALARHESPSRGSRHLGLARALVAGELPRTMAHLSAGRTTEWRATIICQETACLTVGRRRQVDAAIAAELPTLGDGRLRARVRALSTQLDGAAVAGRAARAESARRVTLRPAPTTMAYLTALLPVAQGVAVLAALRKAAADRDPGDSRTVQQICADALVERVTGQAKAEAVPVEVQLVMPAETLFADDMPEDRGDDPDAGSEPGSREGEEPAVIAGHVVPGAFARRILARCHDAEAAVWVRRLFTGPDGADLVALESRRREFSGMLRRFVELRDQTCQTPWCGAPVRHVDHVHQARDGGPTSAANGRGACAGCNYAREAPGWSACVVHDGPAWTDAADPLKESPPGNGRPHTVRLTTPTGHSYDSTAPPILPSRLRGGPVTADDLARVDGEPSPTTRDTSPLERHLELLLTA